MQVVQAAELLLQPGREGRAATHSRGYLLLSAVKYKFRSPRLLVGDPSGLLDFFPGDFWLSDEDIHLSVN